jgi:hypothetical protein
MKRCITLALLLTALAVQAAQTDDPIGLAVETYFDNAFARLGQVAAQKPTVETFRDAIRPCAEATDGFFGGTLIDTDYVIRQTYRRRNALARGFSLRKVKQLDYFWEQMDKNPAPQLSEPGHGSLIQPRLIAMRYPVLTNGELQGVVSMMVRTDNFLEAVGLDKCRAFKIICRGEPAEEKGELSDHYREVKLSLPATDWVIQYYL